MKDSVAAVASLLEDRTGLAAELIGLGPLERAIETMMRQLGFDSAGHVVQHLASGGPDWENLIDEVIVPETWFFRDQEPFTYLETHARKHWIRRPVNVLSACCSTGEEPYSIAMTLLDAGLGADAIRVLGADVCARSVAIARQAEYERNSFRTDLGARLDRHFVRSGSGWKVREEVAKLVHLRQANLIEPGYLWDAGPFDAVFCRNALIYMRDAARKKVLNKLKELMTGEAILFAGHSEIGVFLQDGFERVDHARAFACRKIKPKLEAWQMPPPNVKPLSRSRLRARAARMEPVRIPDPAPGADAPAAALDRARALADSGQLDAAAAICEQLLKDRQGDAEAYYLLGLLSRVSPREQPADAYFERALYLDPCHYESLVNMCLICEQRGELDRSRNFRRRADRAASGRSQKEQTPVKRG